MHQLILTLLMSKTTHPIKTINSCKINLRPTVNIFLAFFASLSFAVAQNDTNLISMDRLGKQDIVDVEIPPASTISSASRNVKNIEDLPFTAYIITRQMIRERGYQTLVEALKDIPGIRVSQPGSAQQGETFSMRGLFGNYYAKILLDDVPIQPSATNGMPLGAQIPLQAVERIEVLFGPSADVYGADAMAGVINIVTIKSDKIRWGNAQVILGSPYLSGARFTLGGKLGKGNRVYNYTMYGGFQQMRDKNIVKGHEAAYNPLNFSNGDSSFVSNPNYKGSLEQPEFNGLPSSSFHAGFRFSGKKLTLGFDAMFREEHSAIGLNPLYVTYSNPNNTFGERIFRGFGIYNTQLGKWNSRTYFSWLSYRQNRGNSYTTLQNPLGIQGQFFSYSASDDFYFEETVNYSWANGFSFQGGFTFQYSGNFPFYNYLQSPINPKDYSPWAKEIKNNPELKALGFEPYNFSNTSVMAQMYYEKNKWELMLGFRYDYNSKYFGAFNPRVGASYKAKKNFILRASISSAFRPPSSYLIYNSVESLELTPGNPIILPSPQFNINPETIITAEIGAKLIISKNQYFDFVVFNYNTLNHIVKTLTVGGNKLFYGYQNSENSRSGLFGVQAEYNVKNMGSKRFFSSASLNYSKGFEVLPFDQGTLNEYREVPVWMAKWLLGFYPTKNLSVSVRNQFFSSWLSSSVFSAELKEASRINGYYTLDLMINYNLTENINAYVNVYNVTNSKYGGLSASNDLGILMGSSIFTESLLYNPQYGTRFTVGVSVKF